MKSNLENALFYAKELKFQVFPVHYISSNGCCSCLGQVELCTPGKHPYGNLVPNGFKNATDNPLVIEEWWSKQPSANIGIVTGKTSGIVVIDIDKHKIDGELELQKLFEKYNVCGFPETLKVHSGGGGYHYYFKYTPQLSKSLSLTGIDIKSNGGYILAPPSNHKSGNSYLWIDSSDNTSLAEVPQWFIDEVFSQKALGKKTKSVNFNKNVYQEGERNNGLMSFAGQVRKLHLNYNQIEATLLTLNKTSCSPPLLDEEVKNIAKSASKYPSDNIDICNIMTSDEIMNANIPPLSWLVPNFVIEGGVTMLSGTSKTGKTWLGLQTAISVALGKPLFAEPVKKGLVIYYHLEDGVRRLKHRLTMMETPPGLPIKFIRKINPLGTDNGIEELRKIIELEKPSLVIIDPLTAGRDLKKSEDKAEDVAAILYPIRGLAQETGVSFIIIHHHKKGENKKDPREDARGSSVISGAVDITAGLYKEKDYHALKLMGNDIEEQEFRLSFTGYKYQFLCSDQESKFTEAQMEIFKNLSDLGEADVQTLAKITERTRERVQQILTQLLFDGVVKRKNKEGSKSGAYIYFLQDKTSIPGVTPLTGFTSIPGIPPLSLPTWKKVV